MSEPNQDNVRTISGNIGTASGIDRDALLELADELSGATLTVPAVYGTYLSGYVAACHDVAHRIREALGVES